MLGLPPPSKGSGGREVVRTAEELAAIACRELRGLRRERAIVVVPDSGCRVVRVERLLEVLRHDGRAFAVAHNHPTGVLEACPPDALATRDLTAAAKIVGVRLLDDLIVTEDGWVSLRAEGVLR
jgi:DNA repair protein RadC